MTHLTVDQLIDVVQSQLCIYGNKKVFVIPEQENWLVFELYAGDDTVIECVSYDESCVGEYGLEVIAERLARMEGSAIIRGSDNTPFKSGFQIGIRSSIDGFVELINSEELIRYTVVCSGNSDSNDEALQVSVRKSLTIIVLPEQRMFHICQEPLSGVGNEAWYPYVEDELFQYVERFLVVGNVAVNVVSVEELRRCGNSIDYLVTYNKCEG